MSKMVVVVILRAEESSPRKTHRRAEKRREGERGLADTPKGLGRKAQGWTRSVLPWVQANRAAVP